MSLAFPWERTARFRMSAASQSRSGARAPSFLASKVGSPKPGSGWIQKGGRVTFSTFGGPKIPTRHTITRHTITRYTITRYTIAFGSVRTMSSVTRFEESQIAPAVDAGGIPASRDTVAAPGLSWGDPGESESLIYSYILGSQENPSRCSF